MDLGSFEGLTGALPPLSLPEAAERIGEPSFYFAEPDGGLEVLGFGLAAALEGRTRDEVVEAIRAASRPGAVRWLDDGRWGRPPGPWFGGFAFDLGRGQGWEGFPAGRWALPELLLWRDADGCRLTAFRPAGQGRRALQEDLWTAGDRLVGARGDRAPLPAPAEGLRVRTDRRAFVAAVGQALQAIRDGRLCKVVLARAVTVEPSRGALEPFAVAQRLRATAPRCATFFVSSAHGSAFLGASPELLCRVEQGRVETQALAGTAALRPGEAPGEAEQRVLGSEKDRREQQAVIDGIVSALSPLTEQLEVAPRPRALALATLVHLHTPISGALREGVGPAEVIAALHPTPAVGGAPRASALGFLAEHEGLRRGWYAGGVGWLGAQSARVAVAIRSALLEAHTAQVFVGAGVVAGSTPEGEWAETEAKAGPMLRALGVTDG